MKEFYFSIHGVGVKLTTELSECCATLDNILQSFPGRGVPVCVDLRVDLRSVSDVEEIPSTLVSSKFEWIPRKGKVEEVTEHLGLTYDLYQNQGLLFVDFHKYGLVLVDGPGGRAQAYFVQPEAMDPDIRSVFVGVSLFELLRWKGLYVIHAVALERFGKGILIAGPPGLGKTTASLPLLRAGYGFISDDYPFLREKGNSVELLTFQDRIDVRENTIDLFPELAGIPFTPRPRTRKFSFSTTELFPKAKVNGCEAHILLFPQMVSGKPSYLEPMPKHRVLKELLPQGLLIHDKELAKRQFRVYTKLVETTTAYQLYSGNDLRELPALLDPLFEECGSNLQKLGA